METKKQVKKIGLLVVLLALAGGGAWAAGSMEAVSFRASLNLSLEALLLLAVMVIGVLLTASVILLVLTFLKPKSHRGRTLVTLASSLTRYAAALVILCWGLTIVGVDVSTIVASVGVLALIVGFGAESLIADVVTGIFMLFENQYNVGDIVEVGGFRGTVQQIGIRTTSIMDTGGNVRIINNSEMKNVLNRSDNASCSVCDIGIPYEADLEALEAKLPELLESIAKAHGELFPAVPEYLGVQALEDSAVVLRFLAQVPEKQIYAAQRMLNRELLLGLRRLGVECPYPQLDVHSR